MSNHILAWSIWIFLSIVWGSSFILIKKALIGLTPIQVAMVRIFVAFMAFLPFMIYRWKHVSRENWKFLALVGIFGNGLPAILYSIAQTKVLSASAGILNALTPIFTLIIGILIFRKKSGISKTVGTIIGFIGAGLLFLDGWSLSAFNTYTLFIIAATFCYGMSVNIVGHSIKNTPPLTIASCSFIVIGPISAVGMATVDPSLWAVQWESVIYVTLLALLSTFIATILFYRLVHLTDPVFSSSVSYFAPIIALLWGLLDGEALAFKHLLALGLILFGVYLIRRQNQVDKKKLSS